ESAFFSSIMEENFGSELIDENLDKVIANIDGIQIKIEPSTIKFEMDFIGEISSCLPVKFKIKANITSDGFIIPNKSFYDLTLYIENVYGAQINITFTQPIGYLLNSYSSAYYEHTGDYPVEIYGSGVYADVNIKMRFSDSVPPIIIIQTNVEIDEDILYYFDTSHSTENTIEGIVLYNWTVSNSTEQLYYLASSNASYLPYCFLNPGEYKIELIIHDLAGNSNSTTINVSVRDKEPPLVVIYTNSMFVNEDENVVFSSFSTDNYQIVLENWEFGDGMQAFGNPVVHTFAEPGNYTITLTVYDGVNYNSSSIMITVLDITPPSVSISAPPSAEEDTVVLLDSFGTSDNDLSFAINGNFMWTIYDYNGNYVRYGRQVTYLFEQPGVYLVVLNVTDSAGNWNESSKYITILDKTRPSANISVFSLIVDEDVPILFSALNSTDNVAILYYEWNFGDNTGTFSNAEEYHVYSLPGRYIVTLTVRDESWSNAAQIEIIVRDKTPPVILYNVETNIFEDENVNFDASNSYDNSVDFTTTGCATWNFFDNATNEKVSIKAWSFTYVFMQPGVYQIELNLSDGSGNFNKTTFVINVKDKTNPNANITLENLTFNEDIPILFSAENSTDNVGITAFTWSFGDETGIYSGVYVLHEYSKPGIYQVTLIVRDEAGLESIASVVVNVRDVTPPIASIDVNPNAEEDFPVVISAWGSSDNVDVINYEWNFGDGVYANGSQVVHVYEMPGVYLINLTVTDKEGNSNYTTRTITIRDITPPSPDFYLPSEWNEDDVITLSARNSTDNVGIVNCTWDLDASNGIDNRDAFGLDFNATFLNPGVYTVTLHVFDAEGNENYTKRNITIIDKTPPKAYAGSAQSTTTGKRVYFNASGSTDNVGIVSYEWDFGDGKSGSGMAVSHVYSKPGRYTVILTVKDAKGLEGKSNIEIEVVNPAQDMRMYYVLASILSIGALLCGIIGMRAYRKWKLGGFRVEDAFLIYQDGRMIGHKSARKEELDSDVVAGMLVAVESFINDTF
ncbi:MAG: PKD domain-containing protein, partial [Thermoplasmata archaeon]